MASYSPSEQWERHSKEAPAANEFLWKPTSPIVQHGLVCSGFGISVRTATAGEVRHSCTGCEWELVLSL